VRAWLRWLKIGRCGTSCWGALEKLGKIEKGTETPEAQRRWAKLWKRRKKLENTKHRISKKLAFSYLF
jgi:hypothetical protein